MRNIKELYQRLSEREEFLERYPLVKEQDDKVHVLFISPCLNGSGYYRAIIPALELNKTSTHLAIISNIHTWDFNQSLTDYVTPVDDRLIEWADYVVLPIMYEDASYLIQGWKAKNPDLQIVMDIDCNVHAMPAQHLNASKISKDLKNQLLSNTAKVDMITSPSEGLLDYYDELIEKHYPKSKVAMEFLPNLVSQFGYQEVESLSKQKDDTIRIGIIASGATHYDVLSILEVLEKIVEQHQEKVELILFGWNGKLPGGQLPLDNLKFTYQKSVRFLDYFNQLNSLSLDLALIPSIPIPFNTHGRSAVRYLELAVFAIPVVASNVEPYNEIIEHKETGFLVDKPEEWLSVINKLIQNKERRTKIGKSALKHVWRKHSFTNQSLKAYQEAFI